MEGAFSTFMIRRHKAVIIEILEFKMGSWGKFPSEYGFEKCVDKSSDKDLGRIQARIWEMTQVIVLVRV